MPNTCSCHFGKSKKKKNFDKELIFISEKLRQAKKANLIWFHARNSTIGFYKRMGYQKIGKLFIKNDAGKHTVMLKKVQG